MPLAQCVLSHHRALSLRWLVSLGRQPRSSTARCESRVHFWAMARRVVRASDSASISEPDEESSDDEEKPFTSEHNNHRSRTMHLQEDIFGHVVVTYLRHGSILDDKIRAIVLMSLVLVGQLLVAGALTLHCISTIYEVEEDLALAVGVSYDSTDVDGTGAIMQRVCGYFTSETEPIADGFGAAFHEHRRFDTFGTPSSRLEQLHYQLRLDFQLVFACVAVFWTWRCFSELRMCWKETLYLTAGQI